MKKKFFSVVLIQVIVTEMAGIVTMDDMINTNVTSIPVKGMVPIKMATDTEESVAMIVTMRHHFRDRFNRIYRHVSRSNINRIVVIAVDSAVAALEALEAHQAIIRSIGTVLPAIITRMIQKTLHSVNHTKRVTTLTLRTTTSNSHRAPHHKCADIHPMK